MCGGSTAHYQAGTTCHIALGVTHRLPLPHTQAGRRSLLKSHHRRCAYQMDNTRFVHHPHIRLHRITPNARSLPTWSPVMPQPKNPRVTVHSRPLQQQGHGRRRSTQAPHPIHPDAPQVVLNPLPGTQPQLPRVV